MRNLNLVLFVCAALLVFPACAKEKPDWLADTDKGLEAYKAADFEKALQYFQKAQKELPKDFEPESTLLLSRFIAETLLSLGKYGEAERTIRINVRDSNNLYGRDTLKTVRSLENMSILYRQTKRYADAEKLAEHILKIKSEKGEPSGLSVAGTLNFLGNLNVNIGDEKQDANHYTDAKDRYQKAVDYYLQSLKIGRENLTGDEPVLVVGMTNLALAYGKLKEYDKAATQYQKALNLARRIYGDQPREISKLLIELGAVFLNAKNYTAAERIFREKIAFDTSEFGKSHIRVGQANYYLALTLAHTDKYRDAESYFETAFEIARDQLGRQHDFTRRVYAEMVAFRWRLN